MSAFNQRIQPLRDLMKAKGLDAFVLRRNPNLAWAIAGRAHVPTTIDMACFDLIITQDSATAITNVVEAPRLIAEELPSEVTVQTVKWSEGRDQLLPTGPKVGSDQPGADRIDLGVEVEMIRASLIESDFSRFQEICVDAAVALGNAMKQVESSDREIDVAGLIAHSLWQADLEIAFLGVAGEERVHKYRHPLPTTAVVGNRVSASICAKRKGLIASVTRIVTFGSVSDQMVLITHQSLKSKPPCLMQRLLENHFQIRSMRPSLHIQPMALMVMNGVSTIKVVQRVTCLVIGQLTRGAPG